MYEFTKESTIDDYKKMVGVLKNINRAYVRFIECLENKERKYWWDPKYTRAPGILLKKIEKDLDKILYYDIKNRDNKKLKDNLYNKIIDFLNIFMEHKLDEDEDRIYDIAIEILDNTNDDLEDQGCNIKEENDGLEEEKNSSSPTNKTSENSKIRKVGFHNNTSNNNNRRTIASRVSQRRRENNNNNIGNGKTLKQRRNENRRRTTFL
jgi:hypothetical protein